MQQINKLSTTQLVVCSICFAAAALWIVLILNMVLIPMHIEVLSIGYWVSFVPALFMVGLGVISVTDISYIIDEEDKY